jgi:hypothetical protein
LKIGGDRGGGRFEVVATCKTQLAVSFPLLLRTGYKLT